MLRRPPQTCPPALRHGPALVRPGVRCSWLRQQRLQRPMPCRYFSMDRHRYKHQYTHMGTVIVRDDTNKDPLRLVAKMSQYPHDPHTPRPKEAMALVLLFTPMFAHSLIENRDSAPTVLTSAIAHIFEPMLIAPGDPQRFLALAAVVDRLPGHGNGPIKDKQGYEGIGYAVMPESLISSTDRTISSKSLPKDAPETGTLTFEVQAMIKNPFFVDTNDGIAHRIEMPLANTIFQTGRNTTMLACQYISAARENTGQAGSREARRNLLFTNRLDLLHQKVTWPLKYWLEHDEVEHYGTQSMHIPLVPLTIPREVRSGMGNIIRETVSAEGKPVPASQELERAVSAYFRAERLVPHAMPVWALVSSRDAAEEMSCRIMERIKLLHRLPLEQTTPTEVQAFISQHFMDVWDTPLRGWTTIMWNAMFKGGARLHRVLSGGGGWGKKAGLLSLDPRVSVVQASEDQPPSFEFDERFDGGRSSLTQPLEEVAKEGEFIQFFAAFKPFRWSDWTPMTPDKTKRMLVLGAIPSSIDDIRHREPDDASLTNIRHHIKFFGVLSEKGMSIHSVLRNGGPSGDKECLRSMVDVPFAMFRQRLPADHLVSGHREIVPEIEPDDFDSSKEPEPEEREEVEAQTDSNKSETGSSKTSYESQAEHVSSIMSVDLGKAYTHRNAIFAAPGHTSLQNRRTYFTHAFAKTNDLVLRDALNLSNSPTVPLENTQSDTLLMGKKLARNRRIHLTQKRLTDSEMKGLMSPEYLPLSHFWAGLKDRVNEIRDIELSYLDYAVWESNYHLVQLTRQAFFIHPTAFPTTNTAEGHAWIQNPDEETIRRETARKEEVFSSQHNDDLALPSFIVIDLITKELDSICQHVEDIGESIYNSLAITETTLTYKRMDDNDDADDKQTQPTQATQTSAPTTLLRYARVDAPPPLLRYAHVDDALSPIVRAKAVKKPLPYKKTKPASPPSVKYKLTGPPKGLLRTVRVGSTKDKTEPDASMTSPNQVLEVKDGRIQITPFAPEPPAPQMRIVWGSEAVRQTQRGALERRKAKMEKASARAQQQKSGGIVRRVKFDALAPGQLEDSPIRPYTSHTETQVPGFEKRMITMASLPLAKRVRKLPTTTPLHLRVLLLRKQLSRSHRVLRKTFNLLGRMDSVRDRWDQIVLWRAQELRRHQDPQGARGRELELQKRSSPLERLAGSMRVSAEEEVEDALGGGVGVGEALPPTTFFLEKPLQRGRGGGGGAGVRVGAEEKEYQAQQPRIRKLVSDTGLTPAQKLLRAEMFDLVRDLDHLLSDLNKEGRDGDEDDEFEDGYGYEDEDEFEFEFEKRDRDGGKGGDGV